MMELIIAVANLLIGGCIGLCGIAGFLLPILYVGILGFSVPEALTLSFLAFIVSGAIGGYNFYKQKNLDVKISCILSAGSLGGAFVGVWLNGVISQNQAKMLLYLVVLFSGVSILVRMRQGNGAKDEGKKTYAPWMLVVLGVITGCICSLSGAGGPVLVMPLLVCLGVPVHSAIGVALFNSVFIGVPAFVGYAMSCDLKKLSLLMVICVISHGIGVMIGSKYSAKIPQKPLKISVSILSIVIAIYMIAGLVF